MFRLSSSTPPWILEDPSAYLSTTLFCSHQWKMIKQLQRNPSTRIQILCLVSYIFSTQDKLYVIKLLYLLDLNLNLYLNTLIICLIILKIMALFLIYLEILGAFVLCYSSCLTWKWAIPRLQADADHSDQAVFQIFP